MNKGALEILRVILVVLMITILIYSIGNAGKLWEIQHIGSLKGTKFLAAIGGILIGVILFESPFILALWWINRKLNK